MDSNPRPFNYESGAPTTELSWLPVVCYGRDFRVHVRTLVNETVFMDSPAYLVVDEDTLIRLFVPFVLLCVSILRHGTCK